jgi:hypothetical protein
MDDPAASREIRSSAVSRIAATACRSAVSAEIHIDFDICRRPQRQSPAR